MPRMSGFSVMSSRGLGADVPLIVGTTVAIADLQGYGRYFGYIRPGSWAASNWAASGGGISEQPVNGLTCDGIFFDNVTNLLHVYFNGDHVTVLSSYATKVTLTVPGGASTTYNLSLLPWELITTSTQSTTDSYVDPYSTPAFTAGASMGVTFGT